MKLLRNNHLQILDEFHINLMFPHNKDNTLSGNFYSLQIQTLYII